MTLAGFFFCSTFVLQSFMENRREFVCRIPASLVKDPSLSPRAKLLYLALAAHADARTGRAYLSLKRLDGLLGCGRRARERAQRELVELNWLRLERKVCGSGKWGARVFVLFFCRQPTIGPFQHSGEKDQLFISHSLGKSGQFPQALTD
jgi:hypothetical protein